jgi:hypothetical protein
MHSNDRMITIKKDCKRHTCPNLDKGTQWGGACDCTRYLIYTNMSKGPIDQASELVNALRAERTNGQG